MKVRSLDVQLTHLYYFSLIVAGLETENAGNRIQLASMELGKDKELEKIVQKGCEVKLSATCKPCFVLLRNGAIVGTIDGLNTGVMSMLLEIHVPKLPKKAE
jgi:hypothetical protein